MRPEALEAFQGCEMILHAGDIGKLEVLDSLRSIASVARLYLSRTNLEHETLELKV